jgi:hypothetical protein
MQEKLVRSAPIDIALVKSMHLTWKMRVRSAVNGFSDWQEVHAQAPEKKRHWAMDSRRWAMEVSARTCVRDVSQTASTSA